MAKFIQYRGNEARDHFSQLLGKMENVSIRDTVGGTVTEFSVSGKRWKFWQGEDGSLKLTLLVK